MTLLFFVLFVSLPEAWGAPWVFQESSIPLEIQDSNPGIEEVRAQLAMITSMEDDFKFEFSPRAIGQANYLETREQALLQFIPVFSPRRDAAVGLEKKFTYGVSGQVLVGADRRTSFPLVNDGTTALATLTLQMDLWRDLLGKTTREREKSLLVARERAKYQKTLGEKGLEIALRKIYWAMVSNRLALGITEGLYKAASRQEQEAKKRKASSIADDGEVARYGAQTSNRLANLTIIRYQQEKLVRQLRALLPKIVNQKVELEEVNMDQSINRVLDCTQKISQYSDLPFQYTPYDEIIALLGEERQRRIKVAEQKDAMDVRLTTSFQTKGVDNNQQPGGSLGGAIDDIQDNNRTGFAVGVQVSVPIGSEGKDARESLKAYEDHRLKGEILRAQAEMGSEHEKILSTIPMLLDVVAAQKKTSSQLKARLQEVEKKFRQARASVTDLINDQDALLNSELSIIDTQLTVVNGLLDYLALFPDFPCEFNLISTTR